MAEHKDIQQPSWNQIFPWEAKLGDWKGPEKSPSPALQQVQKTNKQKTLSPNMYFFRSTSLSAREKEVKWIKVAVCVSCRIGSLHTLVEWKLSHRLGYSCPFSLTSFRLSVIDLRQYHNFQSKLIFTLFSSLKKNDNPITGRRHTHIYRFTCFIGNSGNSEI